MSDQDHTDFAAAVGRLAARVVADPDFRAAVRALVGIVREVAGPIPPAPGERDEPRPAAVAPEVVAVVAAPPAPPAEPVPSPGPEPKPSPRPPTPAPLRREPLPELTFGRPVPPSSRPIGTVVAARDDDEEEADDVLLRVAARCRLKAEATRWAVARKRLIDGGADYSEQVAPTDRDLVDRARSLPNCYLWMNQPDASRVGRDEPGASALAGAYEVSAEAAEMLSAVVDGPKDRLRSLEEALPLMAEAQSALRVCVERLGGHRDADQVALYEWLRETTSARQLYISKYMRLNDPADPARLPDLSRRMAELTQRLGRERGDQRAASQRLRQIEYHVKLIRDDQEPLHHWRKVVDVTAEVVGRKLIAPSAPGLRDLLLPIIDDLPDLEVVPPEFELVVREIERYRDSIPGPSEAAPAREPTPEVLQARQRLRGRSLVMICNVLNPASRDALIRAFGLADLEWIVAREHQSIAGFEAPIARPEVALVLLPKKFTSHSFGGVKAFCDRYGKPLVRIKAGYHPNQVAVQILEQGSEQLDAGRPATA